MQEWKMRDNRVWKACLRISDVPKLMLECKNYVGLSAFDTVMSITVALLTSIPPGRPNNITAGNVRPSVVRPSVCTVVRLSVRTSVGLRPSVHKKFFSDFNDIWYRWRSMSDARCMTRSEVKVKVTTKVKFQ